MLREIGHGVRGFGSHVPAREGIDGRNGTIGLAHTFGLKRGRTREVDVIARTWNGKGEVEVDIPDTRATLVSVVKCEVVMGYEVDDSIGAKPIPKLRG